MTTPATKTIYPAPQWMRLLARPLGLYPEHLHDTDGVREATELVYRIFYEELGWEPLQPNASELLADHDARRFRDRYDRHAIWVGVRDRRGSLVATMRVLDRGALGKLELEEYYPLPLEMVDRAVEPNRVAVAREARGTIVMALLLHHGCAIARRLGATRALGTNSRTIAYGIARRAGWKITGHSFRYHPGDPEPVHVLRYDLSVRHQLFVLARTVWGAARRSLRGAG
ncbi:MAG: GNAT family N-acyltransferase [Nannocystaceae bacterium]